MILGLKLYVSYIKQIRSILFYIKNINCCQAKKDELVKSSNSRRANFEIMRCTYLSYVE